MKSPSPDPDSLLEAILANDEIEALRANSLERMLLVSRQSRQSRQRRRIVAGISLCLAGASAVIFLLAGLFWPAAPEVQKAYAPAAKTPVQTMVQAPALATEAERGVKVVSDDELLALFPGRPVALIGPPGRQKLVFLDEPASSNPL